MAPERPPLRRARSEAIALGLLLLSSDRWEVHYTEKVIEVVDPDGGVRLSEEALQRGAGVQIGATLDPFSRWKVLWYAGELVRTHNREMR